MARGTISALCMLALVACSTALVTPKTQSVLNRLQNQNSFYNLTAETSPYGMAPVLNSIGTLEAGSFLATNWNDAQGNPGQGHTILQIAQNGTASNWATINPNDPTLIAECGANGVGLTMAIVVLSKGYVVVGSTPVPINGTVAGPGCLILLSNNGTFLDAHAANETTTSGTYTGGGPWAFAVQESNGGTNANLYVSYVLGTNPASLSALTGANGGMVVRYGLQLPGGLITPRFWGPSPDVVMDGFTTIPGGILVGSVSPNGLAFSSTPGNGTYATALDNMPLFIASHLGNTLLVVYKANECFILPDASPQCNTTLIARGGLLDGPVGIAISPYGTIVGANRNMGTLFEIAPAPGVNGGNFLADQFVDSANDGPGSVAGAMNLFNVMFHPLWATPALIFNDDRTNSFFTLTDSSTAWRRRA